MIGWLGQDAAVVAGHAVERLALLLEGVRPHAGGPSAFTISRDPEAPARGETGQQRAARDADMAERMRQGYFPGFAASIQSSVDQGNKAQASLGGVDVPDMDDTIAALAAVSDLSQTTMQVAQSIRTQTEMYAVLGQLRDFETSATNLAAQAQGIAQIANQAGTLSGLSGLGAYPSEEDGGPPSQQTLNRIRAQKRRTLGLAGVGQIGPDIVGSIVRGARFRSQLTPDFEYTPGAPGQPATTTQGSGPGAIFMDFLKPDFEIDTPLGTARVAPNGVPTRNYFPFVAVGAVLAAIGGGYLAAKGAAAVVRERRSRRAMPIKTNRRRYAFA